MQRVKPKSQSNTQTAAGRGCFVLFGLVFFLVGAAVGYFMFVRPLVKGIAAGRWPQVPCEIIHSAIGSKSDSDGTQYTLDIHYRYSVRGRQMESRRYSFESGSSNVRGWREEIVRRNPVGTQTLCYVNPDDPKDAVISTSLGGDRWFAFIPIIFTLAGAGIMVAGIRKPRVPKPVPGMVATMRSPTNSPEQSLVGPIELKPASTPLLSFIGITFFAVFWNGFIWGIWFLAKPPTVVKFFLSLFILVGLFAAGAAIKALLALFNPKPVVRASTGGVQLGESVQITWSFTGNVRRISKLTLTLQAQEVATYRRGTDTVTDRNFFHHAVVFESTDFATFCNGQVSLHIPQDSMHSLELPNNKITWLIGLHAEIAKWPDVKLDFPITVLPRTQPSPL